MTRKTVTHGARAIAITGGDGRDEADRAWSSDWIDTPQARGWLSLPRVDTPHHHGAGCVFASAAACAMAWGYCEADALVLAKLCTTAALRAGYRAGEGAGPVRPMQDFARERGGLPTLHPRRPAWPQARFEPLQEPRIGLYAVVDRAEQVVQAVAAGVRTVQLRIKQAPADVLREQVRRGVAAARAAGAQLFVNDHWRLALEEGAYGVHLGQEDLAPARS